MTDGPLTTDELRNYTVVGQAQGIYAGAAQGEVGFLMVLNFAFKIEVQWSTITLAREMPVVGGSGMFRFASGYVETRTKLLDYKMISEANVEYNCYVIALYNYCCIVKL
ncbi:hypothetical protein N665_2233s0008 [Sinapis alba]|nr:hypothetical protein N665_2233s0008 [Sinapis alba]